eukprot:SAG11_NODE_2704_length_3073_cov_4.296907_3_plen_45_part_00
MISPVRLSTVSLPYMLRAMSQVVLQKCCTVAYMVKGYPQIEVEL